MQYRQIYSGDWNDVNRKLEYSMCCSCGLVHKHSYRISHTSSRLQERVSVDTKKTYAARRRGGIKVIKSRDLESAYLAGLLDGEGCIGINKGLRKKGARCAYYVLVVRIANTNKDIINSLKSQYGGFISSPSSMTKTCHTWVLSSRQARDFLREVLPFLRIKRDQANTAILFQDHKDEQYYNKVPEKVIQYREALYLKLRDQKSK